MASYLELFARAIGMPKPIERSRYELDTDCLLYTSDAADE